MTSVSEASAAADAAAAAVSACSSRLGAMAVGGVACCTSTAPAATTATYVSEDPPRPDVPHSTTPKEPGAPRRTVAHGRLEAYTQGLACCYLQGETAYLRCAVLLAAEMSERDAENLTHSLVDDAFYVLLKSFTRSVNSGATTLAVIPLLNSAIVDVIRDDMVPRFTRHLRQAGAADPTNEAFFFAANTMQCADEYTMRLRSVVATSFEQRFSSLVGMADSALAELEEIARSCRESARDAMRALANGLMPTAWLRVEFEPTSYILSTEHAEFEAQHSFETGLLVPLRRKLDPLEEHLRPPNMESLVHSLAAALAEQLEACVALKRFNEAGAILLCEHTRLLIDSLSELVSGSVRNEFGRLNQVAFLLNAGSVQEAAALLLSNLGSAGVGGNGVHLTRAEAARTLILRVEFSKDEIRELLPELDDVEVNAQTSSSVARRVCRLSTSSKSCSVSSS